MEKTKVYWNVVSINSSISHSAKGTPVGRAGWEASSRGPLWVTETQLSKKEKKSHLWPVTIFKVTVFLCGTLPLGQNKEEASDSNLQRRRTPTAGQLLQLWRHSSCVVLQPGVRPEPLRWESRVQDTGPPETSWPHVVSIGESSPKDLCLNAKTQLPSTTSKLQCWAPHAKQLAQQEHNPTH